MSRLESFYNVPGREIHRPTDPIPEIVAGAARYTQESGHPDPLRGVPSRAYRDVEADPATTKRVAVAYDSLPTFSPDAVKSFRSYGGEIGRQFDFMTKPNSKGGLGLNVDVTPEDPYQTPGEMRQDLQGGNMKVLSTEATGGHPFLSNDENDMFRAVHDVFGHAGTGRGFDRHGEEAAFMKHSRMFTPDARPAMASETRGQNSSFIANGDFPDQKVALLRPSDRNPFDNLPRF